VFILEHNPKTMLIHNLPVIRKRIMLMMVIFCITLAGDGIAENKIVATTTISVTVTESFLQYLKQLRAQSPTTNATTPSASSVPRDTTSVFIP
jgi:hypothetical protein